MTTLSYDRQGSGAPVLLLHGLGGYRGLWRPVTERLSDRRDVIAPDLPGFGSSAPLENGRPATAAALAEPVAALCAELGADRPHVAGNSLGAWVGLEMAKRGQAASVLGISVAGLWRNSLGPRRRDSHAAGRRLRPLISLLARTAAGRERLLRTTMARPDLVPPRDAHEVVMNYIGAPGYVAANEAMRAEPFEHEGLIDVPVTLIWGEEDRLVGPPSRTRVPPGARVLTAPGWGHTPTWDDPEGVAKLILEMSEPGRDG
jgi:pimeloyl-ACP methyl ester carboxylesterase